MTAISFEFFPPKTDDQRAQLQRALPQLKARSPEYVSVTFGAGGSTLSYTPEAVRELRESHQLDAAPHLSCVGGSREEILELLTRYRDMGCRRVVALRGDLPSGMAAPGDFRYANELVSFIRSEFGDSFHIEVACYPESHPQARDAQTDLANCKRNVEAGANGAITQYFFNADAYFRFRDDVAAAGIDIPLTAGVMPISNFAQLRRFSQMCGAEIPRWIDTHMTGFGDDTTAIRQFGADVVASMCRRLIEGGVQGLHLYTLNRAQATLAVLDRL